MGIFGKFKMYISKAAFTSLLICVISFNAYTVEAGTLKDLNSVSDYAKEAVSNLSEQKILEGDENGYFKPSSTITREEMVTILVRTLGIDVEEAPEVPAFKDVPVSHWAYRYVEAAYRKGMIDGIAPGVFGIGGQTTREQMAAMFVRTFKLPAGYSSKGIDVGRLNSLSDKSELRDWSRDAVQFALASGLMEGTSDTTFTPRAFAKREQVAVVINRYLNNKENITEFVQNLKDIRVSYNGDYLDLNMKPVLQNGEAMIPVTVFEKIGSDVKFESKEQYVTVKDAADKSGFNIIWDEKSQIISINDNNRVNYPNFYNSLDKFVKFKGEAQTKMSIKMNLDGTPSVMNMDLVMDGKVNYPNSYTKARLTAQLNGNTDVTRDYEIIKLDGKLYVKDSPDASWAEKQLNELLDNGMMFMDPEMDGSENLKLLEKYGDMPFDRAGYVILNGEIVTKYTLSLDNDTVSDVIPDGLLVQQAPSNGGSDEKLKVNIEYYVNRDNQIIKSVSSIKAARIQESGHMNVDIQLVSDFRNIDVDIEIKAPEM